MDINFNELFNYGILGIWTGSLLYDKYRTEKKLIDTIGESTHTLKIMYNVLSKIDTIISVHYEKLEERDELLKTVLTNFLKEYKK